VGVFVERNGKDQTDSPEEKDEGVAKEGREHDGSIPLTFW
jgi:hypothetical protein